MNYYTNSFFISTERYKRKFQKFKEDKLHKDFFLYFSVLDSQILLDISCFDFSYVTESEQSVRGIERNIN